MTSTFRNLKRCERGATAVEFGLIALPLIMVTLGIVETGRVLWTRNDMAQTLDTVERRILIQEKDSSGTPLVATTSGRMTLVTALTDNGRFSSATIEAEEVMSGATYRTIRISNNLRLVFPLNNLPLQLSIVRRVYIPPSS